MTTDVAESTGYVPNIQMSLFGYLVAAIIVVLLLPVAPFLVVAYLIWRALASDHSIESRYDTWRTDPNRVRLEPPQPETDDE